MYRFAFLALLASVTANVYIESQCPDIKPVENFNFASYGQGTWYEVARYQNTAENRGKCGYAEYVLDGDEIKVKNIHVDQNKLAFIEGTAKLADDAGNAGKMIFTLPYGPSGAETKSVLKVLETDYDNYAICYFCKYNEEKKSRQDFAWILSRSKKLEGAIKTTVENYIKDSKVLESAKFVWPDFTDNACRVDA